MLRHMSAVFCLVLAAGCNREVALMQTNAESGNWMDSPEVLAVAFHPRREGHTRHTGFDRLEIPVEPGVMVGGRFYGGAPDGPTILFFHGNGEIVADYHEVAQVFQGQGINFMPVDYRGYGLSTGTPTISNMLADARTVYAFARDWLRDRGYGGRFVVMGRSLGSAPALHLVAAYGPDVDALIIDSGFAHIVPLLNRLGARIAPGAEDHAVGQLANMKAYEGPAVIIHGTRDTIIPIGDAEDLKRASVHPDTRLLRIEGAGHNNIMAVAFNEYFAAVARAAHGSP